MGMSMYVEGIKLPDEDFKKMLAAYHACEEAGIPIPKEINDFFEGETPDELGVVVQLGSEYGDYGDERNHLCCEIFSENGHNGYIIDVSKIPEDIKFIRFVISY
jgi:hypothetical protein